MQFRSTSIRSNQICSIALGALACALAAPASAQTTAAPQAASEDDGRIQDIVVTAQRREESLQSVPLAVTALSADRMANAGVANYTQLQEVTPGLLSQGSNGNATPFIRGIGALGTNPGNDAPVAMYVDGVYVSSKKSNLMAVTDSIERIEVLRGPQGTLFGRNSTGGAVRVITKDPTQDTNGSIQASYGRFNQVGGQLYANTGLSDKVAVNIAASFDRNDGFIKNLAPAINGGGSHVGEDKSVTVRGKIKFTPTEDLSIVLAADYAYSDRSSATAQSALRGFTTVPQLIFGATNPLAVPTYKPRTYIGTNDPISNDRNKGASAEIVWNTPFADLTSLTSYRYDKAHNAIDLDLAATDYFVFEDFQVTKTFQQELRLASSEPGPFKWQTGVFYMHDDAGFDSLRAILQSPLDPTPAELAADTNATRAFTYSRQIVKSRAVFGEASYSFGQTTITGGLRYTSDKVTFAGGSRATLQTANAARTGFVETEIGRIPNDLSRTFNELTYRINVDHKFDNAMIYASFNRGFKSGVYNISALGNTTPTKPEIVQAYEVGTKMDLFDRRFRLNVSAFYNDYKNLQVSITDTAGGGGVQRTENAAAARIYGVEAEATIAPTRDFQINANFAYLNSKYTKYLNASVYAVSPVTGLLGIVPRSLKDAQTPFAPKFTASIGGQYTVRMESGSRVELNANYYYNDGYCIESGCLALAKQPSYNIVNASVTWVAPDDRYFLRAFGKNLLNEDVFSGNTVTNFGVGVTWNKPTTWGVAAGVKF